MANGYSRSPRLLKGALVEFSERFIGPIPNIIIFQYNPESLTRTLEVWEPPTGEDAAQDPAPVQPGDPPETFTLSLLLDATDALEDGNPVARLTGVADRLAALEMLLYPDNQNLLADIAGAVGGALGLGGGGAPEPIPQTLVPIVLFVWGPGRIVPVRLTSFTVEEKAFSPLLYPVHAKVEVGMKVMTPGDLAVYEDSIGKDLAVAAFNFTRTQKRVLAAANLANSADSILGMLSF